MWQSRICHVAVAWYVLQTIYISDESAFIRKFRHFSEFVCRRTKQLYLKKSNWKRYCRGEKMRTQTLTSQPQVTNYRWWKMQKVEYIYIFCKWHEETNKVKTSINWRLKQRKKNASNFFSHKDRDPESERISVRLLWNVRWCIFMPDTHIVSHWERETVTLWGSACNRETEILSLS